MKYGDDITFLKNRLKNIDRKEINELISSIPKEKSNIKEKLTNSIDNLVADYNIIVAYYNKKYYKQGFIDATNINEKANNIK